MGVLQEDGLRRADALGGIGLGLHVDEQLFELPHNPLTAQGYGSIGCWPCTRPTASGEDARAGRWAGSAKTECGLHR